MSLRRFVVFLSILVTLLLALHLVAAAAELAVEVSTDKGEYALGELVTITVRVTLDGQPVSAVIDQAYIDISYSGSVQRNYIRGDFTPVSPGLFVAQGPARRPGARTVYVTAHTTIREGPCCYSTVCESDSAAYTVLQTCQTAPSCCYQPCYPCYQPCPPPLECRAPDFFVKHFVHTLAPGEERPISLRMPDYVLEQLLQRANPVTFREAPPHSVIWSDVPGLGWTNDALTDLGLALDLGTGRISGRLRGETIHKGNYFFFLEALDSGDEVVAGIWIEIAFT